MSAAVDKVIERVDWMEWDEKVALFDALCGYLGEQTVYERLLGAPEGEAKHAIRRKLEALGFSDSWFLFEVMQLKKFFEHFRVDCVFDVGANEGQYVER